MRSVLERALDVTYKEPSLWISYAEMEQRNKFVNRARNVYDRAVELLPRVDNLWLKYALMEEQLGNPAGSRAIFERWMLWKPEAVSWATYVNFEVRQEEWDRARGVYERFVECHPYVETWLKYAKFEERRAVDRARAVYERAAAALGDASNDERFFTQFAEFEAKAKEVERARAIYKYALEALPRGSTGPLYAAYIAFEKRHGDRAGIEDAIVSKKRLAYDAEVTANPHNYDAWFDYARLEEAHAAGGERLDLVRAVYGRAVAARPPVNEKRFWGRYIYLWLMWAVWEETEAKDPQRAREVYAGALRAVPHSAITFAKLWIQAARFEVRQGDLVSARRIFGTALGKCPKPKIFRAYVELESRLGYTDRVRAIMQKWLEYDPAKVATWTEFAGLEKALGETERARGIYDLCLAQDTLDRPEVAWKAAIDAEIEWRDPARVRALYARLLERTGHVKVWLSLVAYELSEAGIGAARETLERAEASMKGQEELKEDRAVLLKEWAEIEAKHGTKESHERIAVRLPKRVKKLVNGAEVNDYVFPEEDEGLKSKKLLDMALNWKKQKTSAT